MKGFVEAVCTSPKGGVPKYPQREVVFTDHGLVGDFHNRPTRLRTDRRGMVRNTDQHVLVVAVETLEGVGPFRLPGSSRINTLEPGSLGENLTVRGLGDLSELKRSELLAVNGGKILLQVTKQAQTCWRISNAYGAKVREAVEGRRGVYCAIRKGAGRRLSPGGIIEILSGGKPVAGEPPPKDKPTANAVEPESEPA